MIARAIKFILQQIRHPAFAVVCAIGCITGVLASGRLAGDEMARMAIADDPVAISDRALDEVFDNAVAEREIRAPLASGDIDLAQSFVDLASERAVAIAPTLSGEVEAARIDAASAKRTAGRFAQGLWSGEPTDLASLAGTALGDLFVFGDIRDAAREGTRYLLGRPADPWIFGLAGVGI